MTDMMEDLNGLKDEIDTAKADRTRIAGRKEEIDKSMRTEFNCRTLPSAKKKRSDFKKTADKSDVIIKKKYEQLKENYEW